MAAGDELPPVIAKFIADVTEWIAPVDEAIRKLEELQGAVDQSALTSEKQVVADKELTTATDAVTEAIDRQREAAYEDTAALEAEALAARHVADAAFYAAAGQQLQNEEAQASASQADPVIAAMERISRAQGDIAKSAHDAGSQVGILRRHFQLSGGLFGTLPILGTVSGFELILHALIEFLAVFIPAITTVAVGLTAWGVAAYQSGKQIFQQLMNIHTVSQALNTTIPPLTNRFQQLSNAVRPQVYELFGVYLDMSSHSSGVLNKLIMQTGQTLDHFFAQIEVHSAAGGGKGLAAFFDAGAKDAALFGVILKNVMSVFITIGEAAMKTHIAEILLGMVAAVSQLLTVINKIPAPLITAFVAFHGIALWGGLAVTQLKNVALAAAQALGAIGGLNRPMTAFAQAIGASSDQLAKMGAASPALKSIAEDIAGGVPGAYQMAQAYGVADANLAKIVGKTPEVEAAAKAVGATVQDVSNFAVAAASSGVAIEELAAKSAGGADQLASLTKNMEGGAGAAANLALAFSGAGKSTATAEEAASGAEKAFATAGTSAGGLTAILSKLGPVLGNVWVDLALVAAALIGVGVYLGMMPDKTQRWINTLNQSVSAASNVDMLGATISALAANTEQLANAQRTATGNTTELANNQADLSSKLQQELVHVGQVQHAFGVDMPQALALLQTAGVKSTDLFTKQGQVWQVDMEMVHGLVDGYRAMGQQIGVVGNDMNVLLVGESQQLSSMQKLNQAWDQFTQLVAAPVSNVLTLAQGFRTLTQDQAAAGASMTGLGANSITLQQQFQTTYGNVQQLFDSFRSAQALSGGQGNFTQFVKDAVASLLPFAGSSKAATAEVSALAQEGGGPATTSMQALAKWVGNVKNPLQAMYSASSQAAIGASNLNQDAAQLTNTLQSDLNPAIAQATLTAYGGQQTLTQYANAVLKYGANSPQAVSAGHAVAQMFLSVDKNSASAKAQFVGWLEAMGETPAQASAAWTAVSRGEKPLASVRDHLARSTEAVQNLGKPGLWGQAEHQFMWFGDRVGKIFTHDIPAAARTVVTFFSTTLPKAIERAWNTAWSSLVSPVINGFNNIKSKILSIWDPWWKSHSDEVKQVWDELWSSVAGPVSRGWSQVMSIIRPGMHALESTWRATWSLVSGETRAVWKGITGVIHGELQIIEGIFRGGWTIISGIVMTAIRAILGIIETDFKLVLDVIGIFLDVMTGHWSRAWGDVKKLASDALHGVIGIIINIASGFGSLLYNAGRAIIQGLINGISSMGGAVMSAVEGIAGSAWNAAKSALHIGSPSRKFMEIGQMIGAGLTNGILLSRQQAVSAARLMASEVTLAAAGVHLRAPGTAGITAGGVTAPGVLSAAAGGTPVVITLNSNVRGEVNQQALFTFVQQETFRYNIRNSGIVTGGLKPGTA